MKRLPWFRLYHEARTDNKLRYLTDSEHRVWFNLLCFASEQRNGRGTIPALGSHILAMEVSNADESLLEQTVAKLTHYGMLVRNDDGSLTFVGFIDRQYDKPSDKPEETRKRQRERRDKGGNDGDGSSVTPPSRGVTPSHAQEERRGEEIREEENTPSYSPEDSGPSESVTPEPSAQGGGVRMSEQELIAYAKRPGVDVPEPVAREYWLTREANMTPEIPFWRKPAGGGEWITLHEQQLAVDLRRFAIEHERRTKPKERNHGYGRGQGSHSVATDVRDCGLNTLLGWAATGVKPGREPEWEYFRPKNGGDAVCRPYGNDNPPVPDTYRRITLSPVPRADYAGGRVS